MIIESCFIVVLCSRFPFDLLGEETIPEALTDKELQTVKAPSDNAYASYAQYFDTMFPLLVSETWHGIVGEWKEKANSAGNKKNETPALWSLVTIKRSSNDIDSLVCRGAAENSDVPYKLLKANTNNTIFPFKFSSVANRNSIPARTTSSS